MRIAICMLLAAGCSKDPGTTPYPDSTGTGVACLTSDDCPPHQWCLYHRCSDRAGADPSGPANDAHLNATPGTLNFGSVAVGGSRTLALVLENDGGSVVTVHDVTFEAPTAPFSLEPLGYGPFWIRPGRARELFFTYTPTQSGSHSATATIHSQAPPVSVNLLGN